MIDYMDMFLQFQEEDKNYLKLKQLTEYLSLEFLIFPKFER